MLLYYITDRKQLAGSDDEQRRLVVRKIAEAAAAGVDYVQLRERDLSARDLGELAHEAVAAVRAAGVHTKLLINSRTDIALACGADGVHLRSDDIAASEARAIARDRSGFIVGVSCHTNEDVRLAWSHGADFTVFGPVFEKNGETGGGLGSLKSASSVSKSQVFALGGVTLENAGKCMAAGAAGIAGIRLFQNNDIGTLVGRVQIGSSPKKGSRDKR